MKCITVLFKKHKKHLPKKIQGTWLGELCRFGFMIFLSAWILQGIRIMNWRETFLKLSLTIIPALLLILLGIPWWISFIIAHTLNFAFNGQLFAMYTHMGATHVTPQHFLEVTEQLAQICAAKSYLNAAIAYGSLSRGCFKSTSDIDLRLIPTKGELNWWKCVFFAFWLRIKSFFKGYPLDLYVYSPKVVVKRMRTDELPIMVNERNKCMMRWYPERVEFDEFVKIFTEANIITK